MWPHKNAYAVFAITVYIRQAGCNPDGEPPAKKAKVSDEGIMDDTEGLYSDQEDLLHIVKREAFANLVSEHPQDMLESLEQCCFAVVVTWPRSGSMHTYHLHVLTCVCSATSTHCTTRMNDRTLLGQRLSWMTSPSKLIPSPRIDV